MILSKLRVKPLCVKFSLIIVLFSPLHLFFSSLIYAQQDDDASGPSSTPFPDMIDTELNPVSKHLNSDGHKIIITSLLIEKGAEPEEDPLADKLFGTPDPDQLFGYRGGNFHAFLSLQGEWTDNLYNLNVDETTNFLTTVSPGIWFGIPRTEKITVRLSTYNTAVGGKRYSQPDSGSFDRFQTYLLGSFDYKNYSANPDLNYTAWNLEGLFQYNLPVGLSFRFMDRFTRGRDQMDIGSFLRQDFTVIDQEIKVTSTPSRIREFVFNQANAALNFNMSERFSALLDYTNFYLDYDDSVNAWLNRTDNTFSLSLSYKYSPKTSFFVEYSQALINYEVDTSNDSVNMFIYSGINWQGSAKTSLMAKGGYQVKKYENIDTGAPDTFTMEAQVNYLVTDKTKMSFSLYKALEESNSLISRGIDTIAAKFRYDQQFSYSIRGYCEFWYEYYDYAGFNRVDGDLFTDEARNDSQFIVKPAMQYYFREWLMAELAYSFENRNSNENIYDFTTQTVFLSLNASF